MSWATCVRIVCARAPRVVPRLGLIFDAAMRKIFRAGPTNAPLETTWLRPGYRARNGTWLRQTIWSEGAFVTHRGRTW